MESLKENEEQYRLVAEASSNLIIIHQDGKIVYVNSSTIEALGARSSQQLIGKSIRQFIHPEYDKNRNLDSNPSPKDGNLENSEQRLITLDERVINTEVSTVKVTFNGKPAVMYIGKDITKHQAENQNWLEVMDKLSESQRIYKTLFENANDVVVLFEITDNQQPCKFINVNRAACEKLGYSLTELLSLSPADITSKKRIEHIPEVLSEITEKGMVVFEGSYTSKSGVEIPLEFNASLLELNGKKVILSIGRDISERKKLEKRLKESEKRYRNLVELGPVGIAIIQFGSFKYINRTGAKKLGAKNPSELINKRFFNFIPSNYHNIIKEHWSTIDEKEEIVENLEGKMIRLDNQIIDVEISGIPLMSDGEQSIQIFFKDITDQKKAKKLMYQMAYFDSLTSLPNRRFLYDYLAKLIADSKQKLPQPSSVLFLDLDGFKAINDKLGHEAGDLLLKKVAGRLNGIVRKNDTVSRLSGDEFIIVIEEADKERTAQVAKRIIKEISYVYYLNGQETFITASIGISFYPNDGNNAETLIKKADHAMYLAKNKGKNNYHFYTEFQY